MADEKLSAKTSYPGYVSGDIMRVDRPGTASYKATTAQAKAFMDEMGYASAASITTRLEVPAVGDTTAPPAYTYLRGFPVQNFAQNDIAYWCLVYPAVYGSGPTIRLTVAMETATSGNLALSVSVDAITPEDAQAVTTESYATANTSTTTVPGTVLYTFQVEIALTNDDSVAGGDLMFIKVERTDALSGGMYLLAADLIATV